MLWTKPVVEMRYSVIFLFVITLHIIVRVTSQYLRGNSTHIITFQEYPVLSGPYSGGRANRLTGNRGLLLRAVDYERVVNFLKYLKLYYIFSIQRVFFFQFSWAGKFLALGTPLQLLQSSFIRFKTYFTSLTFIAREHLIKKKTQIIF